MMMLLQTNGMSADTLGHLNAESRFFIWKAREKERNGTKKKTRFFFQGFSKVLLSLNHRM